MDTNKMRADFEAAFVAKYGFGRLTASANADAHAMYEAAKWAWQASRKAVVVEVPEGSDISDWSLEDQQVVNRKEAIAAIEAQGLKVAP